MLVVIAHLPTSDEHVPGETIRVVSGSIRSVPMISDDLRHSDPLISDHRIPTIGTRRIRRDPVGMNNQVSLMSSSTSIDFYSSPVDGHITRRHRLTDQISLLFTSTSLAFRSSLVEGHIIGQKSADHLIQRSFTGDVSAVIQRFVFRLTTR